MVVEDDDAAIGMVHPLATHLAEALRGARGAAIVQHHVVGRHVDDLADLDGPAPRMPGQDFREGVHSPASCPRST